MRILFISLFLFFTAIVFGQDKVNLDITVLNMSTKKKESGVTATVYDGTKVVASSVTTSKGLVTLSVPAGPMYKVVFTKAGKVQRFFNIDSKGIDMELIQGSEMPFVFCEVSLFDDIQGVDFSYVKNNPFTVFKFDGKSSNLAFNQSMANKMSTTIDQLLSQAEQQEKNNEVQYQAKMKQGEELASQNKYQEAIERFEQALMFKQNDKIASNRIADMEKMLTANQVDIVNGQALNADFDKLVKEAEDLKKLKKYTEAIDKFDAALEIKRGDQYCLDEIDRLEKIIKDEKDAKEREAKYKQSMTLGDQMLGQKSYESALKYYDEALLAKPNDVPATTKKAQVEKLLNADKERLEKKAKYEKLVVEADALYNDQLWEEAKTKYEEAFAIESASTYVSGRIKDIKEKLAAIALEKQNAEKVKNLLVEANTLFSGSKWNEAKVKYQEVLKIDDKNETAIGQIALIDKKLADEKENAEKEQQFTALVKAGDLLITSKKYEEAITKYNEALALKEDIAVQQKIDGAKLEIEKIANASKTKQLYDDAIKQGNELLTKNELENARAKFVEASTLDDTQKLPKDKIAEIDTKIAALKSKQLLEEQFNELMTQADALLAQQDLQGAKSKYEEAKLIDKTSTVPDAKIKEINDIIAKQGKEQQLKDEIAALLKKGDEQFGNQKYEEAIATYTKVLEKDNANSTALSQLELSKKALADALADKQKADAIADRLANYDIEMVKGNMLKNEGKLTEALVAYEKAKGFTDDLTEVNKKIQEVNDLIANAASAKQAKELQEKYQVAFQKAVQLQKDEKYQEALSTYNEAKAIDPSQTEPDAKIKEINQLLADKQQKEEAEKQKIAQVATLFAEGDALVADQKYTEAIAKYTEIKTIDPENKEVDAKIAKANDLMKQSLAQQSQAELEEKYKEAFKKGMDNYAAEKYDDAIAAFTLAKSINSSKPEPQQKIDEITKLKAQLAEQKEAEALAQKYNAFITEGDNNLTSKNYEKSLAAYQKATDLMPSEDYPKKKIQEVKDLMELDNLGKEQEQLDAQYASFIQKGDADFSTEKYEQAMVNYKEAQKAKNTDDVKTKILQTQDKITALLKQNEEKQVEQQYSHYMDVAKNAEVANNLQEAIDNYKKASRIKEEEQEPKTKVAELTEVLKKKEAQAENDRQYNLAMTKGKEAFEKEEYNVAIKHYNEALGLKKEEQEPKDMIALSEEKLKNSSSKDEDVQFEKMLQFAQQKIDEKDYKKAMELIVRAESNRPNDKRLLEMKKKVQEILVQEEEYQLLLTNADNTAALKEYTKAIELYKKASEMKPAEVYPVNRIADIKEIIAATEKQLENQKKYEELLITAKGLMVKNDLDGALSFANEAVRLIPSDSRANDLVKEIQDLIAAKSNKSNKKALEAQFKLLLATADNLFEKKQWSEAKIAYEKAQVIYQKDTYVVDQIKKCDDELAKKEVNKSKYIAIIAIADNDFNLSNLEKAKSGYELALTYDDTQNYPAEQIATINRLLKQKVADNGTNLNPLGEEIDNSLLDGAMLLARAEEYRKTAKGELVKEEKRKAVTHSDSVIAIREDLVAQNLDTLKKTKGILIDDLTEYYDNQFDKDKQIKDVDKSQTDLMIQWGNYNYSDNVENKRKMVIIDGMKVEREKQYVDHNFDLVDSVRFIRHDLENRFEEYTNSDYDFIMQDKNTLDITKELQEQNKKDESGKHDIIVDLSKNERENAIQEEGRQYLILGDKIDNVTNVLDETEATDLERKTYFKKNHEGLTDAVKDAQTYAIDEDNKNFNDVYTKQIKAKDKVTSEQQLADNTNKEYTENKSLDIDKSRERLNNVSLKYNSDLNNDDEQREDARLFMKETEQNHVTQNSTEKIKGELKVDNVKNIAEKEKTLQQTSTTTKKETLYDTRSELKELEVSKVTYSPKVANQIGKDYPEGVSQETFKQNGPDGLPIAIVTRRIVVKNGYGDVYTRTQKYGFITYSKNGDVCTESIWRNETTDPKMEKHY